MFDLTHNKPNQWWPWQFLVLRILK